MLRKNRFAEMSRRARRPVGRRAEMPRMRRGEEDEYADMDLDSILGVDDEFGGEFGDELMDDDEIVEVDEEEFEEFECPPGCVPAKDVEDEEAEGEEGDEEGEEKDEEDKEDEDEKEEEKAEEKEAAVATSKVKGKWTMLHSEDEINGIDRNAEVAMLYHASDDPHYVVVVDGKPMGEIRRSDLITDDATKDLFSTEEFPQHVTAAIQQLGFANVAPDLNIRYYAAKVTDKAAQGKAEALMTTAATQTIQTKLAELKNSLIHNVKLAMEASIKNVVLDNPLRDAVRAKFKTAGVPDAVIVDLFEDAMQDSGAKYFEAMLDQADEWLGYEKDSMAQVEKMIKKAGYVAPQARGLEVDPFVPQRNTMPALRTMAPAPQRQAAAPTDDMDSSAQAIRRGLLKSGSITRGR